MKKMAIIVVSLITALTGVVPAQAFPTVAAPKIEAGQNIQQKNVQQVQYWDRGRGRGWDRGDRRWRDRDRYYGNRHYRRHRGSNAGAIIGGLAAGAIIGGAIAQSQAPRYYNAPRRYTGGNAHTSWCYNRYRSYRAYDNTFQPYNGPRQACYSPY